MPILVWNDALRVGFNTIDEQHEVLLDCINDFYHNLYNRDLEKLEQSLVELYYFSEFHFQTEEKLMYQFCSPDIKQHIKEHNAFLDIIKSYQSNLKVGALNFSIDLIEFLKNSIVQHIVILDKSLAELCLKEKLKSNSVI